MSAASAKVPEPSMEEILASIRRIISDDQDGSRAAPAGPASPARAEGADGDVLDLADLKPGPASLRPLELEHEDVSFRDAEEPGAAAPVTEPDEADPEPEPAYEPPPRPSPGPEPLLSEATQASAANAFRKLSTTMHTASPRTLEDLVTEMLRPMLKAWLDENLPPLVERLVRAEIERVTRGR